MACATAKKDRSSRYANSIRARSTRLAGSVRERAIAPNSAKSFSPIANSIACRHAVMSSTLSANQSRKPRTHVGKCESSTYDGFHGIDVLGAHVYADIDPILLDEGDCRGGFETCPYRERLRLLHSAAGRPGARTDAQAREGKFRAR